MFALNQQVEAALTLAAVLVAVFAPGLVNAVPGRAPATLRRWMDDPARQLALIAILAVGLRAALLPVLGAPEPMVTDEYSTLLQAEIFASGRWAMPQHPLWPHFEVMHVIHNPTYASIYFPGRGFPPMVGILLGHPWIGVWLSAVAMCVAITWMLQAWTTTRLAFVGGLIVVLKYAVVSYWVNSYWGGAFTALGATLVLGAFPRLLRTTRWRDGGLLGLGALILMVSRPFEGALFCAVIGLAALPWLLRRLRAGDFAPLLKAGAPLALLVGLGGVIIVSQNLATTGEPLKTPYELGREQYALAPAMWVSPPYQRTDWSSPDLKSVYTLEYEAYARFATPAGVVRALARKTVDIWAFYVGPALSLPFLLGLFVLLRRDPLVPVVLACGMAGFAITTWDFVHYAAPMLPLAMVAIMAGFERLGALSGRAAAAGRALTRLLPLATACGLALGVLSLTTGWPAMTSNNWSLACCTLRTQSERSPLERWLRAQGEPAIVLLRMSPDVPTDLAYNAADIDGSKIIWARDMGARNAELLQHYPGRAVWFARFDLGGVVVRGADGRRLTCAVSKHEHDIDECVEGERNADP